MNQRIRCILEDLEAVRENLLAAEAYPQFLMARRTMIAQRLNHFLPSARQID